jgi:hypothetical protein
MGRAIAAVMTKPDVGGKSRNSRGLFQRRRVWEK